MEKEILITSYNRLLPPLQDSVQAFLQKEAELVQLKDSLTEWTNALTKRREELAVARQKVDNCDKLIIKTTAQLAVIDGSDHANKYALTNYLNSAHVVFYNESKKLLSAMDAIADYERQIDQTKRDITNTQGFVQSLNAGIHSRLSGIGPILNMLEIETNKNYNSDYLLSLLNVEDFSGDDLTPLLRFEKIEDNESSGEQTI